MRGTDSLEHLWLQLEAEDSDSHAHLLQPGVEDFEPLWLAHDFFSTQVPAAAAPSLPLVPALPPRRLHPGPSTTAPSRMQESVAVEPGRKDVVEGDPCPRCGSQDTKFHCHTRGKLQHFCKECRRYWTKGGTLRKDVVEVDPWTPCLRCGSQDTKYRSSTGGIPRYFCKGCQRSWTEGIRLRKYVLERDRKASFFSPSCHAATTTTTTDGASEVATETVLAAPPAALVAEEDSDSVAHMFWQPEVEDVVALGLGLSDLPSAGKAPLDDDLLVWPVEFDTARGGLAMMTRRTLPASCSTSRDSVSVTARGVLQPAVLSSGVRFACDRPF